MEGLQMGVMTETQTSIISPNASPPANPIHANQTPGSHGGADSRCRTDHEVENSAITPCGRASSNPDRRSIRTECDDISLRFHPRRPFPLCYRRFLPLLL